MEFDSKFIEAAGLRTHYLEAGNGPTLILVHGGGAGADAWGNWRTCIPRYANDFRVLAVDMVGFGKTEKPDPEGYEYSQSNRNVHMTAFIEAVSDDPVYIIGNSMGGAASLGIAMNHPDLLNRMVLMGSAGIAISNPDKSVMQALSGYDFTRDGMRRVMEILTGPDYRIDEDLLEYRYELTLQPDTRMALGAIGKATKKSGLTYPEEDVAKVQTPTLVVGGKEDKIAVLARNYRYLELLENSWGFILPHCGHWVMIERPEEFVAVTSAFFTLDGFGTSSPRD